MFSWFGQKNTNEQPVIDENNVPAHVAIIMDGNGRWAKKRRLPRVAGHKRGMNTVKTVTIAASQLGIKVLTLYAFSTENWKRPDNEVNYLMQLPVEFFDTFVPELVKNNVSVRVMGVLDQLPKATRQAVERAIEDTQHCDGMILNFALNYGGRAELTTTVKSIVKEVVNGDYDADSIDEELISDRLMTADLGVYRDPDLLIRTSGEQRLSNFLLWQVAYSEFVFLGPHWPEFTPELLVQAVFQFQQRTRRFGGLKNH